MTEASPCKIEPVAGRQIAEAVGFISGGSRRSSDALARANALMRLVGMQGKDGSYVYWARRGKIIQAAAMVVANPGRAGMLFYSWPTLPGVDSIALHDVIREVSLQALHSNIQFVQALLDCQAPASANEDAAVLPACGYKFLAELLYMSLSLTAPQMQLNTLQQENAYQWKSMLEMNRDDLADVIARTYEQSLDCPGLAGCRQIHDVIAGHKSCGLYDPQNWWFPYVADKPAGCVLISDYPQLNSADVVYLGVVPEFRGKSLARVMLRRAERMAWQRGMSSMTLAVDSANHYAVQAYQAEGFVPTCRRVGYAMMRQI